MPDAQRILITGATGFLGRRLVHNLKSEGRHVLALGRSVRAREAIAAMGAEPVGGDLDDVDTLKLPPADAIIHAAAYFRLAGPRAPYFKINVEGTRALLAAASKAGIKSFVAVGAAAVVMDDRGSAVDGLDETAPVFPNSFSAYIASKAQAEALIRSANSATMRTVVVRPPGIWGRGDAFATALPGLVKRGLFGFIGGGNFPYVTCHVDNVVEGVFCALERGRGGSAYFVNDAEPTTFRSFAIGIASQLGLSIETSRSFPYGVAMTMGRVMEGIAALTRAKADPPLSRSMVRLIGRQFVTSDALARREIGYQGRVTRAEGLAGYAAAGG